MPLRLLHRGPASSGSSSALSALVLFLLSIATGVAMTDAAFDYKGKQIVIREQHPDAVVSVDGREFRCHHHHPKEDQGLAMWMCEEAYFASPDIRELARHFADYGYMFDDPGRVLVDESGEVVERGGGPPHDHEDPDPGPAAPEDHGAGGGH